MITKIEEWKNNHSHKSMDDLFLLSYDKSNQETDKKKSEESNEEFRKLLVGMLIKFDPGCKLTSPVASTIYITPQSKIFKQYIEFLSDIEELYFTLAIVARKNGYFKRRSLPKPGLSASFKEIYLDLKKKQKTGELNKIYERLKSILDIKFKSR